MPESVPPAQLGTWIEEQVSSGKAIAVERATEIASEFAQTFVADWKARNYQLESARLETSDAKVDFEGKVVDSWYAIRFIQVPFWERGEVVVTEAPILLWVDPWTSEVLWFARNVVHDARIEPRIAFCGPLMDVARARQLWEERTQLETQGPDRRFRVLGNPTFKLQVDVAWDEHDIPSGRPVWHIGFGVLTIDPGDPQDAGGFGLGAEMIVDAISGQIIRFKIGL